jgi:hypothetical protein
MHIDENKKFDKRNIEKNIKNGIITQKDYEIYLSKLPEVGEKLFILEEDATDLDETELIEENEAAPYKKGIKKKTRGKGK